jgi:hypothetical protein
MLLKKRRTIRGLTNIKRLAERMWSGHLVYSNLVALLFGTVVEYGALRPCER